MVVWGLAHTTRRVGMEIKGDGMIVLGSRNYANWRQSHSLIHQADGPAYSAS